MSGKGGLGVRFRVDVISTYALSWLLVQIVVIAIVGYWAMAYHRFRTVGLLYGALSAVLVGFVAYAAARHSEKAFYGFVTAVVTVIVALLLWALSRYLTDAVGTWGELMHRAFFSAFSRTARIGFGAGWVWLVGVAMTVLGSFAGARAARPVQID
jgi:hypothetical protein